MLPIFRFLSASVLGGLLVFADAHVGALAEDIQSAAARAAHGYSVLLLNGMRMKELKQNSPEFREALQKARAGAGEARAAIEIVLAKDPDYVINPGMEFATPATEVQTVSSGSLEALNGLLREDLKLHLANQDNQGLGEGDFPKLVQLVPRGDLDAIRAEVERTGRPNAHYQNQTALMEAAKRGKTDVIELLIDKGADVNWVSWASSPLSEAAKNGHASAVRLLVEKGALINLQNGKNLNTPLLDAIQKGHNDVVIALVEMNADVSIVDWRGSSPMDWARDRKLVNVVRLLEFEEKGPRSGYTPHEVLAPFGNASEILARNSRELAMMEKAVASVNGAEDPGCTRTRKLDKDIKATIARLENFGDKDGAAQASRIHRTFVKGAKSGCLKG